MQPIYLQRAREEFKEAVIWYEEREAGLGADLEKEVLEKVELITKHPIRYRISKAYYREAVIKRFPYLIIYRYNKSKKLITILSIFQTSRNPKYKYRK